MIKFYCDICNKDITKEREYKLQIRTRCDFLEKEELVCGDCKDRILKYIDRILRNDKNENNL